MFSSKSDLWCTPQELFDALNKEFNFTYDLCATKHSTKCKDFCSPEEDAFKKSIVSETIWCNPPYGREIGKWVKLCYEKQKWADAQTVVMLIPARTDTKWFHDYILGKAEIRFIKGRLKFINKEDAEKFEIHTPQCATNAAEVADEFAVMGCTCGAKTRISPAPFPSMLVIYGKKPAIYGANKLGLLVAEVARRCVSGVGSLVVKS